MNYYKIAIDYAREHNHDVVLATEWLGDYIYFRIDYRVRPRYLGHPIIIRMDKKGNISDVNDWKEAGRLARLATTVVL